MWKFSFMILFFFLSLAELPGKRYEFQAVDFEGKILSNQIFCFYHDSEGFIWIGTANGLYRYNGFDYDQFFHVSGDSTSISSNDIKAIVEDKEGNLWIGTANGLNRYNKKNNCFQWFLHDELNAASISANRIATFHLSSDGSLYIGTNEGLNKMIVDDTRHIYFERFYPPRKNTRTKSELSVQDIYEAPDQSLWVGTWGGGILHFNTGTGEFTSYLPPVKGHSFNDFAITDIEEINDSMVWASSYSGYIYTFNLNHRTFQMFSPTHPLGKLKKEHLAIYKLRMDKEGKLWIGTSKRLYIYDPEQQKMLHEGTKIGKPGFEKIKDNANTVYRDNDDLMWVGYSNNGIDIHDPEPRLFDNFHFSLNTGNKYRDYVKSIVVDTNQSYWISTWGDGLIKSDSLGNVQERIFLSELTSESGSDIITSMEIDASNNLVIGTQYGLIYYDPSEKKVKNVFLHDPSDHLSLSDNHIYRVLNDDSTHFWIISQESIRLFDTRKGILTRKAFLESMALVKIGSILKDSDGNYWLATYSNGLYFYDMEKENYTIYHSNPANPKSLCSNEVRWLFEDSSGNIWIATNNGVCIFDKSVKEFNNFREIPELSFKTIMHITEDNRGNIWIMGYNDLIVYDPLNHSIVTYDKKDGLSNLADYLTKDMKGNILITDEKGFYRINPGSMKRREDVSPLYITDLHLHGDAVKVAEEPLNGIAVMYKKKISLDHNQNNFSLGFAAIDYRNPSRVRYEYKLAGYNDAWINVGKKNQVNFMNLSPGTYFFSVRTPDNPGNIASMEINILPPPWRTGWAYAVYIFLIFSLIFAYRNYTIQKERGKSKQALSQLKLNFFMNISHELRTPLTLVTGPLERLIKDEKTARYKDKLNVIYRNAHRMQQLVNQILDTRELEVGKLILHAREMSFTRFMEDFLYSFKTHAEDHNISLKVSYHLKDPTMYFDPDLMEKAFSNILINAFKHSGENDNLEIRIEEIRDEDVYQNFIKYTREMHMVKTSNKMNKKNGSNRFLAVEFTDNGPGVNETDYEKIFERFYQLKYRNGYTAPGSGIGLSLTRDLIQLINGFIFISSEACKGTTFVLYFPVSADAFSMAPQSDFKDEPYLSFDYTRILTKSSNGNHNDENIDKEIQPADNKFIRKPAILVVDDNQELLDYIFEILNKDYTLILRNDGKVAFQTAAEESIDLIISDVMMPVMDGIEFCWKIKNDLRRSHIPVILLTARSSMENELEGLDSGADDYISKPFNESILIKRVQNTILNRQKVWEKMKSGPAPIPAEIKLSSRDREFMEKAVAIVEEHLSSTRFNQDIFSMEMGMSKSSLYRKINGLTNQSINEFVRNIRLKKAAEILRCGEQVHIGELTYQVGFSEPSYFTKKFRELFGETPKSYNNKYINKSRITGDSDEFY